MHIYFAGPLFTPYQRQYISDCAARLRAAGHSVFVPHEHEFKVRTAEGIFDVDYAGVKAAHAIVALLDGLIADDGTCVEIGIFYGLKQHDPGKKGVLGLLTDIRARSAHALAHEAGINLFLLGCIEKMGAVYHDMDGVLAHLQRWEEDGKREK